MAAVELDVLDAPGCPYLGLAADRRTRFTFSHPGQRCFATRPPSLIEEGYQAGVCLSPDYAACGRYRALGQVAGSEAGEDRVGAGLAEALARIGIERGTTRAEAADAPSGPGDEGIDPRVLQRTSLPWEGAASEAPVEGDVTAAPAAAAAVAEAAVVAAAPPPPVEEAPPPPVEPPVLPIWPSNVGWGPNASPSVSTSVSTSPNVSAGAGTSPSASAGTSATAGTSPGAKGSVRAHGAPLRSAGELAAQDAERKAAGPDLAPWRRARDDEAVPEEPPLQRAVGRIRARIWGAHPPMAVDAYDDDDRSRPRSLAVRIAAGVLILLILAVVGFGAAFLFGNVLEGHLGVGPGPTSSPTASAIPPASVSPSVLASLSPSARPSSSPTATPRTGAVTHVVQSGETLKTIAAFYGVTVQQIASANGITDPNSILAGQHLLIPAPTP